jgi:hypothetical protein
MIVYVCLCVLCGLIPQTGNIHNHWAELKATSVAEYVGNRLDKDVSDFQGFWEGLSEPAKAELRRDIAQAASENRLQIFLVDLHHRLVVRFHYTYIIIVNILYEIV